MRFAVLLALALVACGGSANTPDPTATPAKTAAAAPTVAPEDQPACDALYARLQRVGNALTASSELITQAANPKELSTKIATEWGPRLERATTWAEGGLAVGGLLLPVRAADPGASRASSSTTASSPMPWMNCIT